MPICSIPSCKTNLASIKELREHQKKWHPNHKVAPLLPTKRKSNHVGENNLWDEKYLEREYDFSPLRLEGVIDLLRPKTLSRLQLLALAWTRFHFPLSGFIDQWNIPRIYATLYYLVDEETKNGKRRERPALR